MGKLILMICQVKLQNSQKFIYQISYSKMTRTRIKSLRKTFLELKNLKKKIRKIVKLKIKKLRKRKSMRRNLKSLKSLKLIYLRKILSKSIKKRRNNLLQRKIPRKKRTMKLLQEKMKSKKKFLLKIYLNNQRKLLNRKEISSKLLKRAK